MIHGGIPAIFNSDLTLNREATAQWWRSSWCKRLYFPAQIAPCYKAQKVGPSSQYQMLSIYQPPKYRRPVRCSDRWWPSAPLLNPLPNEYPHPQTKDYLQTSNAAVDDHIRKYSRRGCVRALQSFVSLFIPNAASLHPTLLFEIVNEVLFISASVFSIIKCNKTWARNSSLHP